jgi:predicted RNase H-like HicB family nuclease
MQYTLIPTEKSEGGIQVTIPALPACTLEAATRDEALRLAREAIARPVSRSEIVQIEIPNSSGQRRSLEGCRGSGSGRPRPTPRGMPSSMTSSSAVRPRGRWNSADVSLGCEYPPHLWPGPCDLLVSPGEPWSEKNPG